MTQLNTDDLKELKSKVIAKFPKGTVGHPPDTRITLIECCFNPLLRDEKGRIQELIIIEILWGEDLPKIKEKRGKDAYEKKLEQKIKKQLPDLIKKVNNVIHGKDPNFPVNKGILFNIKKSGKYVIPIFNDAKLIVIERENYFGIGTWKQIENDWLEGYYFGNNKPSMGSLTIKINYEDYKKEGKKSWLTDNIKNKRKEDYKNWIIDEESKSMIHYPGPTYGVLRINSDDFMGDTNVEFVLYPTDHFYFLAAQEEYELKKPKHDELEVHDPIPKFSHSISAVGFLVVKKRNKKYAIFAKRSTSAKLGTGAGKIGLPICVTPRRKPSSEEKKDLMEGFQCKGISKKNIRKLLRSEPENSNLFFNALIRGAEEEVGIEITKNDIKILAYGLDTQRYLYSVIAFIEIEMPTKEIEIRSTQSVFGGIQYEKDGIEHVLFRTKAIADFIKKLDKSEFCPTTAKAAYYACFHCYGAEEVATHFGV